MITAQRVGVALVITFLLLGQGGVAGAHSELLSSDPAAGATVSTSPAWVALTFIQEIQPGFSVVTVIAPDGAQLQTGAPAEDGATVSTAVRSLPVAGDYTIGYRVLSADSHPIEGTVSFTFAGPPTAPAAAPSASSGRPAPTPAALPATPGGPDSGMPVWPWLLAVAVLLTAGVAAALRFGRAP